MYSKPTTHVIVDWDKTIARPTKASFESIIWAIQMALADFGKTPDQLDIDKILQESQGTTELSLAWSIAGHRDIIIHRNQRDTFAQTLFGYRAQYLRDHPDTLWEALNPDAIALLCFMKRAGYEITLCTGNPTEVMAKRIDQYLNSTTIPPEVAELLSDLKASMVCGDRYKERIHMLKAAEEQHPEALEHLYIADSEKDLTAVYQRNGIHMSPEEVSEQGIPYAHSASRSTTFATVRGGMDKSNLLILYINRPQQDWLVDCASMFSDIPDAGAFDYTSATGVRPIAAIPPGRERTRPFQLNTPSLFAPSILTWAIPRLHIRNHEIHGHLGKTVKTMVDSADWFHDMWLAAQKQEEMIDLEWHREASQESIR